ncbi:hypothetical protein NM208_g5566 [Fusarium decemcellulare]|uniref:Uncharacterized protein n=1 Tax=Fusarium decemcellulare TaxID=57161 RepID=A0ACC1SGI0_9HYPO|nr:hypothetical protein NM208_g5566 [Fusarium decemcellulare]
MPGKRTRNSRQANTTREGHEPPAQVLSESHQLSPAPTSEQSHEQENPKKRRRRILSCDTCRRLKCRCEFDDGSDTCSRIPCLKGDSLDQYPTTSETAYQPDLLKSLHDRVLELENSMIGLKSKLEGRQPHGETRPVRNEPLEAQRKPNDDSVLADDIEPADQHVHESPAEIIRRVGSQLSGGYRRTLHPQGDIVTMGLIDAATSSNLVTAFIRRRGHILLINSESDLTPSGNLIYSSPFLHAVCCLHEMRWTQTSEEDSIKHRLVYEHVRDISGQVMLSSPLPLEEITGVLIMALFAAAPSRGPEYLDSWLLSGHCAQQAMLCIRFSDILKRTNAGKSISTDLRSIRLWANVCLVHLHWSATTGRPSILPASYLHQCKCLLGFEQATMRDAMVFAEIELYVALQRNSYDKLETTKEGICASLTGWKQKWSHLLELPTGRMLKMSYNIASLILAKRSLDQLEVSEWSPQDATETKAIHTLVCEFAAQVITSFVDMSTANSGDLPEFHLLCVAYATLLLSQQDELPASVSRISIIQSLEEVKRRCDQLKTLSSALRFSVQRALEKLRADVHDIEVAVERARLAVPVDVDVVAPGLGQGEVFQFDTAMESLESMDFFFNGGYLDLLEFENH